MMFYKAEQIKLKRKILLKTWREAFYVAEKRSRRRKISSEDLTKKLE